MAKSLDIPNNTLKRMLECVARSAIYDLKDEGRESERFVCMDCGSGEGSAHKPWCIHEEALRLLKQLD